MKNQYKLHKEFCEIEGCDAPKEVLEHHHIIPRIDANTSNNPMNLAVLCGNHHKFLDSGILEIIGVYPSTNKYGRKLIYKLNGIPNVSEINAPYYSPKPKQMLLTQKWVKDE